LNVPVHGLIELVKRQEMLFILNQAAYGFWRSLGILGLKSRQ
jgi:hypothetical protein